MQPYVAVVTPLANGGTLIQPMNTAAHPEHPIVVPPPGGGNGKPPTDAHPEHPIYYPPVPTHPIVLPPEGPPPDEKPPTGPVGALEWHTVWTEEYGWAVIGVATGDHVTPSSATQGRRK